MRKLVMLAVVVAAAASFMVAGTASAGPAEIFSDTNTFWFDGDGDPVFISDADIQIVVTNNDNGTINVRAYGTLPEGSVLPTKTVQFTDESTGFICGFAGTTSFKGVTTPSGQFSFTCKAP
jgi:hypothetical protein